MSEDFTQGEILRLTALDRALNSQRSTDRPADILASAKMYLAFLTDTKEPK